jgi:glycosyltransferase involved in cell wall biosynthesis
MDSFTQMLSFGMYSRGHQINVWSPEPFLTKLPVGKAAKKWLGYIDQYVLFPIVLKFRIEKCSKETLFVFTDQALGPWIPTLKHKKHIVHCHDFLALQSAKGIIPENQTGWTGKLYQKFIERGFTVGKNFISVSNNTDVHLNRYIKHSQANTAVVYNGLNQIFVPINQKYARANIAKEIGINVDSGYFLHVGGNQWYKNRRGVIEIYNAWRQNSEIIIPLLLIGESLSSELKEAISKSNFKNDIFALSQKENEFINLAYSGATLLLFPSFAEGFGWPIAEAMACGCQVITTNEAPMTEVGGTAAYYIGRRPINKDEIPYWAAEVADLISKIMQLSDVERQLVAEAGLENSKRFNLNESLNKIEKIYLKVVQED